MPLGIGTGQVVALVRDARKLDDDPGYVLVAGPLSEVLARALAEGAEEPGRVRTVGEPATAAAVVVVLAGTLAPEELRVARAASRAYVPVVAVQTRGGSDDVPYVLAEHVVNVAPGEGFPVDRIAVAIADAVQDAGVPLAARLPALREAVERRLVRRAVVRSALVGASPSSTEQHFPQLVLGQARMLMELDATSGVSRSDDPRDAAVSVGLPLASAVTVGLLARTAFRRGPLHGPLAAGAVAVLGTLAVRVLGRAASPPR